MPPPPPTGGYGPPTTPGSGRYGLPPGSNPYSLSTYEPDAGYGQPSRRGPLRFIALGAAILLGLFLMAFVAGQFLGGRSSGNPSADTTLPGTQPSAASSGQPSTAPSATSAPTASPTQGITGNARFSRLTSSITGRCNTANGCPVSATFKNNGGPGSGQVTFNLTDEGGSTTYGTCTTQIPQTEAGQTATASCNANGDALGQLFHTNPNATVYLQTVVS